MKDPEIDRSTQNIWSRWKTALWFLVLAAVLFLPQLPEMAKPVSYLEQTADDKAEAVAVSSNTARQLGFVLLGIGGLIAIARKGGQQLRWNGPIALTVIAICTVSGLSYLWSIDPPATIRRFAVLMLFLAGTFATTKRWNRSTIVRFIVFCGSANLFIGFLTEIMHGRFTPLDVDYRFTGVLLHPNQQGQACAILALTSVVAYRSRTGYRILNALVTVQALTFLVLTKSRNSLAGCIAALATIWFLTSKAHTRRRVIFLVVMVVFAIALIAGELFVEYLPEAVSLGRESEDVMTFTGRIPLWGVCLNFIKERPITGYGFSAFWTPSHIDMVSFDVGWPVPSAHSAIMEVLLALGAVGLALHTFFFLAEWRVNIRKFRRCNNFGYPLVASYVVLFLVLGTMESTTIFGVSTMNFFALTMMFSTAFEADEPNGVKAGRLGTTTRRVRQRIPSGKK